MPSNEPAVEVFKRYATSVATLQEAWVFVFEHADEFTTPAIEIKPKSVFDLADPAETWMQEFDAIVYGTVRRGED